MNKETLQAIKKGSDVLKSIHGSLYVLALSSAHDQHQSGTGLTVVSTCCAQYRRPGGQRHGRRAHSARAHKRDQRRHLEPGRDGHRRAPPFACTSHQSSADEYLRENQVDASELEDELAELEQEELNKRLAGADSVPLHSPGVSTAGKYSLTAYGIGVREREGRATKLGLAR